jgi:hypothetical protein
VTPSSCAGRLLPVVAILLPGGAVAADSLSRGTVSLEARAFNPDEFDETEDNGVALATALEIKWRSQSGKLAAVLRGFGRFDALDDTRNIVDLESAYVSYTVKALSVLAGVQILNWTATEAFHPADVMNSRNYDSDPENPEKLGEPMLEVRLRIFQGYLDAYFMPARIPPVLPNTTSRLSLFGPNPAGLELGDTLWVDRDGATSESYFSPQGALRLSQTIGKADIALYAVDHSDRAQPTFTLESGEGVVRPTFHSVFHAGLTYTQVIGSLIAKFEGGWRFFREPDEIAAADVDAQSDHGEAAAGLEYGWTTDAGHDATFIAEGTAVILDDREKARELSLLQGDLLVAYRHAFNDVQGKEIRLGLTVDVERPSEYAASVRWAQALTDVWSIIGIVRSARLLGNDIQEVQATLQRNF